MKWFIRTKLKEILFYYGSVRGTQKDLVSLLHSCFALLLLQQFDIVSASVQPFEIDP